MSTTFQPIFVQTILFKFTLQSLYKIYDHDERKLAIPSAEQSPIQIVIKPFGPLHMTIFLSGLCDWGLWAHTLVNGWVSEKTSDSEPWTAKNELKTSLLCFSGNFRWSFISCPLVTHYFFAFMIVTSLSYNDPLSNNNIPHNFRVVQMIWSSPYGAHSQM